MVPLRGGACRPRTATAKVVYPDGVNLGELRLDRPDRAVRAAALAGASLLIAGLVTAPPAAAAPAAQAAAAATAAAVSSPAQAAGTPQRTKIRLGLHDYQTQDAYLYLKPTRRAPLTMRNACWLRMSTSMARLRAQLRAFEGLPGVFTGCASTPDSWKYQSGPLSGHSSNASSDLYGHGSAATPSVAAYTRWLRQLKQTMGSDLLAWEVWNEPDLAGFYRGTPQDLVDLTFAAERVLGRKRVIAPSFSTGPYYQAHDPSGSYENGRLLSKSEVFVRYWTLLVKRANAKGVPLPVSAANVHGYGKHETIDGSVRIRTDVLRMFRNSLAKVLRRYDLPIWDTEWNFRRMGDPHPTQGLGFSDTRVNVNAWKRSVREAACLGYERQFVYTWTQGRSIDDFVATTLQLNPNTPRMIAAYRKMNGRTISCDGVVPAGRSTKPLPQIPVPKPHTLITDAPPARVTTAKKKHRVRFAFTTSQRNADYRCRLSGPSVSASRWRGCSSPTSFRVKDGRYRFAVRAISGGVADPTPARRTFVVVR